MTALLTYRGEPKPTAWVYDRQLLVEAQQLGIDIGPLPRANALNAAWREYLEQRIGRWFVLGKLSPRKRGQRGRGRQPSTGNNATRAKERARRREAYHKRAAQRKLPYVVR